jgi:hypothetical protein
MAGKAAGTLRVPAAARIGYHNQSGLRAIGAQPERERSEGKFKAPAFVCR